MSTKLALILAIVCGFIAAIGMNSWLQDTEIQRNKETMPLPCLASRVRIKKGQALKETDFIAKKVPKDLVASNMIPWGDRISYVGKLTEVEIEPGNLIFSNLLDNNRKETGVSRFFIKEGMRAVTLSVDQVSGVAGLIRPGDYVDVIGSFDIEKKNGQRTANASNISLTNDIRTVYLLQAVKVIAIDQQVMAGQGEVSRRRRGTYRTVTLEVRPEDNLRLINASRNGRIQLALRNPGEAEIVGGLQEVREDNEAVRSKPSEYWNIGREIDNLPPYDGGR